MRYSNSYVLILGLLASQVAFADPFLYSIGPDAGFVPQQLFAADAGGSGPAQSLFPLGDGSMGFIGGIAYRSSNSTFYVISQDSLGNSEFNAFTLAGGPPAAAQFALGTGFTGGLTLDTSDGFFYAVGSDSLGASTLFHIDTAGGSAIPLFALGSGFTGGLAFDSKTGLFYAVSNDALGNSTLYSITSGGTVTPLAINLGQGVTGGLAYDPTADLFYAISNDALGTSTLREFSLADNSPNSLFDLGTGFGNAALTLGPPAPVIASTPEPSSAVLLGASLLVAAFLKRRIAK